MQKDSRKRFFCFLVTSFAVGLGHLQASDLCDPDRPFCGRITIIIVSADEFPGLYWDVIKGVDDDLTDPGSAYAWQDFHFFRRHNGTPAQMIVITSDVKLRAKLEHLPDHIKAEAGFVGATPASRDAFEDFLSEDQDVSLLQKAVTNLGGNSVLPYLKTEIVIEGHNASRTYNTSVGVTEAIDGIGLWSSRSETGTQEEWANKPDAPMVDKGLIQRLRDKLGTGVVQVFIDACNGARIGENFQAAGSCCAYLSVTDGLTLKGAGGNIPSPFLAIMPDRGKAIRALKMRSSGAANVGVLAAQMLQQFQRYTAGGDKVVGYQPIFDASNHIDPLMPFVYNSTDAKAERILSQLYTSNIDRDRCDALLKAEFSEQLPKPLTTGDREISANGDLTRLLDMTSDLRRSYTRYTENLEVPSGGHTFSDDMKKFRDCAISKHPIAKCSQIDKLLRIADEGSLPGGQQTIGDQKLIIAIKAISEDFDKLDAPTLVERYRHREITISDLFTKLATLRLDHDRFQGQINSYADNYYRGNLPPELKLALNEANKSFQNAMLDVQMKFFPLLRTSVLEVRLARIEEAAKLLVLRGDEVKSLDAKDELRQLANNLVCLTAYPVGPAFDAKYAKELNSR